MSVSSKELFDIQANIEYEFSLKRVRHMTRTYSQMHGIDKSHNSVQSFVEFGQMVEYSLKNLVVVGSGPVALT